MTIKAAIIADSISPAGIRLTTLQLRYPKFIHGEFMTHRVFSRNASSSRAIPVERLIKDVIDDPVYPSFWGKNQPGMSADEECNELIKFGQGFTREEAWDKAREETIYTARKFHEAGYHKQIVNRLLEPFCHINVVVTATEWSNFFALRCHKDAQPEMRILAEAIRDVMESGSGPVRREPGFSWHLPYVTVDEWRSLLARHAAIQDHAFDIGRRISVARCARVSYLTQDGRSPNIDEDLKLYERLVGSVPLHASPCEHQAIPDCPYKGGEAGSKWQQPHLHGNFTGWIQYRQLLPGQCQ